TPEADAVSVADVAGAAGRGSDFGFTSGSGSSARAAAAMARMATRANAFCRSVCTHSLLRFLDLRPVLFDIGRDLDVRQRGGELPLRGGVLARLEQGDGVVVAITLFAFLEAPHAREGAGGGGEITDAVETLADLQQVGMRELW